MNGEINAQETKAIDGMLKRNKKLVIGGTIHGEFGAILCRKGEVNRNQLHALLKGAKGNSLSYIERNDSIILLPNGEKKKARTAISPKSHTGRSKNYNGIFDRIIKLTEKEGDRKRFENFDLMPKEDVYYSLTNTLFLRDIRDNIKEELDNTEFYTGDNLENCIGEIVENKPLYNASIDKTIISISLLKEEIDILKKEGRRKESAKKCCDIEYIIASSLLQDYSIRSSEDAKYQRGREHGKKSSEELKGKVLDKVRGGVLHHENHIEERSKRWCELPSYARIIALANDIYNKSRDGQFKQRISRFGNSIQLDYKPFFRSLSLLEPGRSVDAFTNSVFEYETVLAKTGENIPEKLKIYTQEVIKKKIIKNIKDNHIRFKLNAAFDEYTSKRKESQY